jgi:hypothetical protein
MSEAIVASKTGGLLAWNNIWFARNQGAVEGMMWEVHRFTESVTTNALVFTDFLSLA